MNFSPELVTLLFIVLLCTFIGLYFFATDGEKKLSNRIIGTFFLMAAVNFIFYIFLYQGLIDVHTNNIFSISISTFSSQLLYFFIVSKGNSNFKLSSIPNYHLVILGFSALLPFISKDFQVHFFYARLVDVFYYVLIFRFISQYRSVRSEYFSTKEGRRFQWPILIVIATLVQSFFPFVWSLLDRYSNVDLDHTGLRLLAGSTVIFYLLFVLWVVLTRSSRTSPIETKPSGGEKYGQSSLTEEQKSEHLKTLLELMEEEKIYLDPSLKLSDVAEKLETSPKYVSQIINEKTLQNFYEFVNSFRIEHSKNLLAQKSSSEMNVSQIMYNSGFNSKSSFNTLFKRATGQTPSTFRKKVH